MNVPLTISSPTTLGVPHALRLSVPHLGLILFLLALFLLALTAARAEEWPCFRGPSHQGTSSESGLPLRWSASENIAWKVDVPGRGWSSPIVWGDRVFVTSASDDGAACRVIAIDRRTGKTLWTTEVFRQTPGNKQEKNSYATPTPVTDGERVYSVFGDGSIAALTIGGDVIWTNRDFPFYSQHGLGASPVLHGDLLVMPYDGSSRGATEDERKVGWKIPWDRAVIAGLDKLTGKPRWKASRGLSRIAHVTPTVLAANGRELLVSGAGDIVEAHDLKTGERLWWIYSKGEGVVPSIVLGDELIYSASGFEDPTIRAVRPGGKGDVTGTHIAWEQKKGVPNQPSFVYVKPHLFTVTDGGVVTCLDGASGQLIWQERIGGSHSASPVAADGRIYFLAENGESAVIEAGPSFKLLARNSVGEKCQASMAVSRKQIFIRSEKSLFAIGKE
jgi:outer membrane protein assembly factor BamB